MKRSELITLLECTIEWLRVNESFEGSIRYQKRGPEMFNVQCGIRHGSGQGSMILVQDKFDE
jgi:hypothetical protein